MKIKIVCWGTEEYILCNAIEGGFYDINNQRIKRGYYLLDGNKLELVNVKESSELFYKECIRTKKDEILVMFLKSINKDNLSIIRDIELIKKSVIIADYNEIELTKKNKNILEKINYVHFINESNIDIKSLMYIIIDKYKNLKDNLHKGITVLAGIKEDNTSLGGLVIDILKNFSYISNGEKLQLNLRSCRELNLEEKLNIEDALKEYMDLGTVLIITQSIVENIGNKLYYNIASI